MLSFLQQKTRSKNRSNDLILVLKVIDGKKPKSATGLVDSRLFTNENNLHAKVDGMNLWSFEYDSGILPPALKQKFTSFTKAKRFAEEYFNKRNIEIVEVKDYYATSSN